MFNKISFTIIFCCFLNFAFCQTEPDPKWSNKYYSPPLKGIDLSKLIDEIKFKPYLTKGDTRTFKIAVLQLTPQALRQVDIDSWYLCSTKHDDYFEVWNMYYTKITKAFWDEKCKILMGLMCLDGTAKAPKPGEN